MAYLLEHLDGPEQDKADETALEGIKYTCLIGQHYRWAVWAVPKNKDGKLDHNAAL